MIRKQPELVIADTSCLILLSKVALLEILPKLYKEIYTTQTVADEFGAGFPSWIIVRNPNSIPDFGINIDMGEATAIALAIEIADSTLIIDEAKGRKVAAKLKLHYTGTIGVLKRAKREGHIDSLRSVLLKIQQTNFRLSQKLIDETLQEFNE